MSAPAQPATVFVVDDDRGLARLLERALQRAGHATASASSGLDAINWLAQHRPDLLLLDLKLQDLEGRELISQLEALGRTVPFLVITGQGDERVAVEMMKRGALDYVVKDAQFVDHVPAVVQRALAQVKRDRELARTQAELERKEAELREAQRLGRIGSWYWDAETDQDASRSSLELFRIFGLDPARPLPAFRDQKGRLYPEGSWERINEAVQATLRTGVGYELDVEALRADGQPIWITTRSEVVRDAAGRIIGLRGTAQDITERKRLEQEILDISEQEQRRIGQDLHDGICQQLAGIELMAQVLEQALARKSKKHSTQAGQIAAHVREAISQTRMLAHGLCPVVLESEGLMSALQELAHATAKMFGVNCAFRCEQPVHIHDNTTATHLYRIAQEAVGNALKHGKSRRIEIGLAAEADRVFLAVKDDGCGISDAPPRTGAGLRIMQYRAGMIGGSVVVQRGEPGGTTVACSVHQSPPPR